MSKSAQLPSFTQADRRFFLGLALAPLAIAALLFLALRGVPGSVAAVLGFGCAALACRTLRAQRTARVAFAQWRAYLPPGFQGVPAYPIRRDSAAMVLRYGEIGMGGPSVEEWLLEDGALIGEVANGWSNSADKRYSAAITDARNGRSFVVYDRREHVCYHYEDENADRIFARLFSNTIDARLLASRERKWVVLEQVLREARKQAYAQCRGLWLPESMRKDFQPDVLSCELAPDITLSAPWHAPDDLRTLRHPLEPIEHPLRRICLNGAPAGFWCRDLQALAAPDGRSFIVAGMVIDKRMDNAGGRWYLWRKDGGWLAIDDEIRARDGEILGYLAAIDALSGSVARFRVRLAAAEARRGYVQTAQHATPLKAAIKVDGDGATCELALPKSVSPAPAY